jgi:hypothetical protein
MKTYTPAELKNILKLHAKFLRGESDGVRADISRTNLLGANLSGADLEDANLSRADLSCANLSGAVLEDANLKESALGPRSIVPEEGPFVGWKKVAGGTVLKLQILGARVSPYAARKCRTTSVRVLEAMGSKESEFRSIYDPEFVYAVGATVTVENANLDPRLVCTTGIHFYVTREEAEQHF